MKKIYTFLTIAIGASAFAQTPIITGIMDGDCFGGTPKAVEIYASGTVNFADYSLENQTNANTTWGTTLNLAGLGTVTNGFVYVILGGNNGATPPVENVEIFTTEFSSIPSASILVPPAGTGNPQPLNVNGDDRIRIINAATSAVVDQFGEEGVDGTGTAWEYLDSWAKRVNGTGPDGAAFNVANWTFGTNDYADGGAGGSLNGHGSCQDGTAFSTLVPFGTFALGLNESAIAGLKIYPNPVTGSNLYISTNANATKNVAIFDVLGKQILNTKIEGETVNVSALKSGVYIVKVTEEGRTATRKLVVK